VSVTVDISESRLRAGVVGLAVGLAGLIALVGVLFSVLGGRGQNLAVTVLLISVAFYFLVSGVFVVLKIIDWFEARQRTR
jgi:inner membrane protein involved in colicin E2 resistance